MTLVVAVTARLLLSFSVTVTPAIGAPAAAVPLTELPHTYTWQAKSPMVPTCHNSPPFKSGAQTSTRPPLVTPR